MVRTSVVLLLEPGRSWHTKTERTTRQDKTRGFRDILEQIGGPERQHGQYLQPPGFGGRPPEYMVYHGDNKRGMSQEKTLAMQLDRYSIYA